MGYAQLLEVLENLPPERRAEVLDFAQFLAARHKAGQSGQLPSDAVRSEWSSAEFSRLALSQAMRGMEDDPVSYDERDLKERWS